MVVRVLGGHLPPHAGGQASRESSTLVTDTIRRRKLATRITTEDELCSLASGQPGLHACLLCRPAAASGVLCCAMGTSARNDGYQKATGSCRHGCQPSCDDWHPRPSPLHLTSLVSKMRTCVAPRRLHTHAPGVLWVVLGLGRTNLTGALGASLA